MAKRGRKPLWTKKCTALALAAARQGKSDKQICELTGVSTTTFYKAKNENPEFSEALFKAKEKTNIQVAESVKKIAEGYWFDEVTEITKIIGDKKHVERKVVKKWVQPDVGAAKMWLYNRDKKNWKAKNEAEQDTNVNITFNPAPPPKPKGEESA